MKRWNISQRIVLIFAIMVCLLMLIQFFIYRGVVEIIENQRKQDLSYTVKELNTAMNSQTTILKRYSGSVLSKIDLSDCWSEEGFDIAKAYTKLYSSLHGFNRCIDQQLHLAVFDTDGNCKGSNSLSEDGIEALRSSFHAYQEINRYTLSSQFDFFKTVENPYDEIYVVCYSPIYLYQFSPTQKLRIGSIALYTKMNAKSLLLSEEPLADTNIMISSVDGEQAFPFIEKELKGKNQESIGELTIRIQNTDWMIQGSLYQSPTLQRWNLLRVYVLLDIIVILTMFAWLLFEFQYSVSRPIKKLVKYMMTYAPNKQQPPLHLDSNSDFNYISEQVNELLIKNKKSSDEILDIQYQLYEAELEKYRLELQTLQSQISPHFLYNTLECIRSIAVVYRISEIEQAAYSLAQLMRYSLKANPTVPLKEELQILDEYIDIMKIRYPDHYEILSDIPKDFYSVILPKMTLQPIFENIFKYASKPEQKTLKISMEAEQDNRMLVITISDNGCGMSEDEVAQMNKRLKTEKATNADHIGLQNVNRRIKIYCGNEYGLSIDSQIDQFTTVKLTLPIVDAHQQDK